MHEKEKTSVRGFFLFFFFLLKLPRSEKMWNWQREARLGGLWVGIQIYKKKNQYIYIRV